MGTASEHGSGPRSSPGGGGADEVESLRWELEGLGLSAYEARVVLALVRIGSASPAQLAKVADVPRTSAYQVLDELRAKGLADRVPSDGPAVWTVRGAEDVLARLVAIEEERLQDHRQRSERVRERLAAITAPAPAAALPYVRLVHGPTQARTLYDELLGSACQEVLVAVRPPYSRAPGRPNPVVLAAAARVRVRAVYGRGQVTDPSAGGWRREAAAYHEAGVEARVVDEVPAKLAVVDRRVALLTVEDPVLPQVGFPTSLVLDHPALAALQAEGFEHLWSAGVPYGDRPAPA